VTSPDQPRAVGLPAAGDSFAEQAAATVRERCDLSPGVAVVLGSGLGEGVSADLEGCHQFLYQELPGFPPPSVPGHAGLLRLGELYGVEVALFEGRIHFYEGHGMNAATLISRVAAALGVTTLLLTNSSGGLRDGLPRGGLMVIEDHLNFMGESPLSGWRFPDGTPAFVDQSGVYDSGLRIATEAAAAEAGVDLAAGVYAALPGPTYETPAEAAFLARAGADAVGMSTVPEATAGVALGLRVAGISCITNMAGTTSSHEEVLASAAKGAEALRAILSRILPEAHSP
jgi:purine-nucleoside phosphorylase